MIPSSLLFTDTSTGGTPTMWNWSFGDSSWFNTTLSSGRNQIPTYTSVGTYTSYLTVSNADSGSVTEGRTIIVTNATSKIGVYGSGGWLDSNGNFTWDAGTDEQYTFGAEGGTFMATGMVMEG